ncbi:MAG: ABC transporter permease subunit [Candidatus Carbobacillus sp.]|nr:ABC transporter permease subunit [Candidatus Carbobacillus sp.]
MNRAREVLLKKEIADHIHSWRFNILIALIALTATASMVTVAQTIRDVLAKASDQPFGEVFVFLQMLTASNGRLPSFLAFVTFLAPLLGIAMTFDAISSERQKGTLLRLLAQPLYRDDIILAKWLSSLFVMTVFFLALGFFVIGLGILIFGLPPSFEEVLRIVVFLVVTALYVAVWMSLGILFSLVFRQGATSVLAALAMWLFFTLFYPMIVDVVAPVKQTGTPDEIFSSIAWHQGLSRLSPATIYDEATTTLLTPSVRALGPLSLEQLVGAIPTPLPFLESLLLIWPQIVGLLAMSVILFAISFTLFMRQDIRSTRA